ncbi:MAG: hypothetical protein WBP26_00990 [Candidatus Saccharimonadales bacterium]
MSKTQLGNSGSKDTIYVDVDDEITAIIEKVTNSSSKIVALVLPKRATVLQSIVNMKLLKRTADEAKKGLVLITTEAGLLPIAGVVGIHVAKSLQSRPAIPNSPGMADDTPDDIGDTLAEEIEDFDPTVNQGRSVGDLAAASVAGAAVADNLDDDETIEIDDATDEAAGTAGSDDAQPAKTKKDKDKKVPNFNRFRKWIIFGGIGLVLLIVAGVFAFVVLPKATIEVTTDSRDVTVSKTLIASTAAATVSENGNEITVPAKSVQQSKTQTQKADSTGQKNLGETAEGTVKMTAKVCSPPLDTPKDVPSGTGVTSNGKTFITQEKASFSYSGSGGGCFNFTTGNVGIRAQSSGAAYNLAENSSFTVAGRSELTATGSTEGGTDNIVKVVSQADVDGAKAKIAASDTTAISNELKNQLNGGGWMAVTTSFAAGEPKVTLSNQVGEQADSVTVTQVTDYTMIGVKQSDLKTIITNDVKEQIKDSEQQNIVSDGASSARFTVLSSQDPNKVQMTMVATASVGPNLSEEDVKNIAAGKKTGDIKSELEKIDGVTKVSVEYTPFWVSKVPSSSGKITVVFNKSGN